MKKLFKIFGILLLVFIIGGILSLFNTEESKENNIVDVSKNGKSKSLTKEEINKKTDSLNSEILKLKSFYYEEKDDFKAVTWVLPKSEKGTYGNTIYCYFGYDVNYVYSPRIVIRYHGDDWIFWNKAVFLIDGEIFNYYPEKKPIRDNDSSVWEKSDSSISDLDIILFDKIIKAKEVKYRLEGNSGVRDFILSKSKKENIERVLSLNSLMNEKKNIENNNVIEK